MHIKRQLGEKGTFDTFGSALWSAVGEITQADNITIGQPIDNTSLYIVDTHFQLVPAGAKGELMIGGLGVSLGYQGQPDMTADRFVTLPHLGSGPFYRTGDLARRRTDGGLEVLGRLDHQVKLRGFRIEVGEVEAALAALDYVRAAICVVREDRPGDQRFVGYLVPEGTFRAEPTFLKATLSQTLPAYMIPSQFVWLSPFPLPRINKFNQKPLICEAHIHDCKTPKIHVCFTCSFRD